MRSHTLAGWLLLAMTLGSGCSAPAAAAPARAPGTDLARWLPAAEGGESQAQYLLALVYEGRGTPADCAMAASWYRRAAEQGLPYAQYNLGLLLARGQGAAQDQRRSAELIALAAEGGLGEAQVRLASMYEHGSLVKQNLVTAHMWYSLAAASGSGAAALEVDRLERSMQRYQIAYAERLATEWSASRAGTLDEAGPPQAR